MQFKVVKQNIRVRHEESNTLRDGSNHFRGIFSNSLNSLCETIETFFISASSDPNSLHICLGFLIKGLGVFLVQTFPRIKFLFCHYLAPRRRFSEHLVKCRKQRFDILLRETKEHLLLNGIFDEFIHLLFQTSEAISRLFERINPRRHEFFSGRLGVGFRTEASKSFCKILVQFLKAFLRVCNSLIKVVDFTFVFLLSILSCFIQCY